jgi:hypothetical protein
MPCYKARWLGIVLSHLRRKERAEDGAPMLVVGLHGSRLCRVGCFKKKVRRVDVRAEARTLHNSSRLNRDEWGACCVSSQRIQYQHNPACDQVSGGFAGFYFY